MSSSQQLQQQQHARDASGSSSKAGFSEDTAGVGGTLTARFLYPSGATYEGEYRIVQGVPQRNGTGKLVDGHVMYDGGWKEDKYHGTGVYHGASGCVYEGQFVEGEFQGHGVYQWPDGSRYAGAWSRNHMHGDGEYLSSDGVRYIGKFNNGMYVSGRALVAVR